MLSTWVHEMGHGIVAILVNGNFHKFVIRPDFSGTAFTSYNGNGINRALISLGGLLGPAIAGGIIINISRRASHDNLILIILGISSAFTGLFLSASGFTLIVMSCYALTFFSIAMLPLPEIKKLIVQVLGIQFCLNDFFINTLFSLNICRIIIFYEHADIQTKERVNEEIILAKLSQ